MDRYICIHGHFYQPPRENPWLETIEIQDSAHPYHDWNERINIECYAPNGMSRILDGSGRIVKIVNNYANISFDFGPTLIGWLKENAPETYRAILAADRESQASFGGHGSAMAQAYNHMILPLANRRDKHTQVVWGIRDFQHHFGRAPEGMWIPETAVDLETLEIMAELGVRFTILTPHQAYRVRRVDGRFWRDVRGGLIDTTMAYQVRLPSGRTIAAFFYDWSIASSIAFGDLLGSGERFARRMMDALSEARPWPQLVHVATDGETYGHHHAHGDMALAYALNDIGTSSLARLTNYGEYLELHPPTYEVEIVENSSWSCVHGVERWRSDCGCHTGGDAGWTQAWRKPLREALDWLRDTLIPTYEAMARPLLRDPWQARDDYIDVILDRSPESKQQFLDRHALHPLDDAERVTTIKLLELQRHAMLMYTSCGWFFNDISGIETVQVLQYAGRVLQLAQELFGDSLEERFLQRVQAAKSNIAERGDGRTLYEKFVKPAFLDWEKVGAHYALSSLFKSYPEHAKVYCYTFDREDQRRFVNGRAELAVGRVRVTCVITTESKVLEYGALYSGDHALNAGVRQAGNEEAYEELASDLGGAFSRADLLGILRRMDKHFGESTYDLKSLFRDEQRTLLERMTDSVRDEAETVHRQLYEHHGSLMRFLADLDAPLTDLRLPVPKGLRAAAELVLNADLRRAIEADPPDLKQARLVLEEAALWHAALDGAELPYTMKQAAERLAERLQAAPQDFSVLKSLEELVELAHSMPFWVDLWRVQNIYYVMLRTVYPAGRTRAAAGDAAARQWVRHFTVLGEKLRVRVD